jgi:ATP-dependent DNA helicase RecQ
VDMASESLPSLWRLREMQAFVRILLADRTRLLSIADLTDILNSLPQSRWTDLIGEGIGTLARELEEKTAPVPDVVEWLGEWARDARAEQRTLLLLTAHRAKGLEFDHVAILDGGWDRPSRGEDADAPRRLFYVAMTRARASLTLLTSGRHPFVRGEAPAILERRAMPGTVRPSVGLRRYVVPDPKLVDLSYAGRLPDGHPSLTAVAQARVGDPVSLRREGDRWTIRDASGGVLGRMSRAFSPPDDLRLVRGAVAAILSWRTEDGEASYRHLHRRNEWEVVLPELVFANDVPAEVAHWCKGDDCS